MPRFILLVITILLVAAPAFLLQSCKGEPAAAVAPAGNSADIVVLEDGATIAARKGTRDRAMTDWIGAAGLDGKSFNFGSRTFLPGTAKFTREGLGDAAMLATLLDATADARVALIGRRESGDDAALGQKRAEALASFLEARGIAKDRLSIRAEGGGGDAAPAQLTLIAERGSWSEPIKAGASASVPGS